MSFLPDELKRQPFKCPNCGEYISSEANTCKFCSAEISQEQKDFALNQKKLETKNAILNSHKKTIFLGVIFLLIGVFTIFQPIISVNYGRDSYSCLTPICIIIGVVILCKGLVDYFKDNK